MKEIRKKSSRPLKISLPGGKTLRVGPSNVARISDSAAEHAAVQKLVADDLIEILGDGEGVAGNRSSGVGGKQAQANIKSFRRGSGDR